MTNKEIVEYLKENRNKGVIISFMPKEVQNFCHLHKQNLLVWQSGHWYKFDADDIADDDAVTLSDNFELKEKSQGEWEEFKIDVKGNFHFFKDGDISYYFWANWNIFLKANPEFTAFGGWQYEDCKSWFLTPQIYNKRGFHDHHFTDDGECKPEIPAKIRFWRESQ